jgi:hypothetical protein
MFVLETGFRAVIRNHGFAEQKEIFTLTGTAIKNEDEVDTAKKSFDLPIRIQLDLWIRNPDTGTGRQPWPAKN